jgi:D-alanyl-lipoteichoic acid acyltransferase DltB (MBOAT superfamily)
VLFPTLNFLLFFLAVSVSVALARRNFAATKLILVVASYGFYACWNWKFCLLLAASTAVSFAAGLALGGTDVPRRRRRVVAAAVAIHLILLGTFKYFDFFVGSLNDLARLLGLGHEIPFVDIVLPVGISFYTFHGISYVVDVYRGDVAICRRPVDMLLYLSFFPQLVAGPIVRAAYFLPQLERPAPPGTIAIGPALWLIVIGLFKKVVVANYLATDLVDPVFFDPASFGGIDRLAAIYGYAVEIYCDFSAYTDIAIGVAALLGFRFPRNFDQPYRAARLAEFWRRWHISLSSWLRDYLYIPLGGSRRGPVRTYGNLLITMLLGGIWHGAAWKFVFWGALHGAGLAAERAAGGLIGQAPRSLPGRILSTVVVFHIVCLGWVFFRADSFETAWTYLASPAGTGIVQLGPLTLMLLAGGLAAQFLPPDLADRGADAVGRWPVWAQGLGAGVAVALVDALGPDGVAPFIYFQF